MTDPLDVKAFCLVPFSVIVKLRVILTLPLTACLQYLFICIPHRRVATNQTDCGALNEILIHIYGSEGPWRPHCGVRMIV